MTSSQIILTDLNLNPLEINMPELLLKLYGIRKIPIFPTRVTIKIMGMHIAEINAIRRVLTDECMHYYMTTNEATLETDDPYINMPKLENYISQIPLCYSISKDIVKKLRLGINIKNNTTNSIAVLAGDLTIESKDVELKNPIFDPTFELFSVGSGKQVTIHNIQIINNYGKYYSGANLTCNAVYRFLDIEEYSLEDINRKENRIKSFVGQSGYKVSSLLANPTHHELSFVVPATSKKYKSEINQILIDVCDNIIYRLRNILIYIENSSKNSSYQSDSIQSSILENVDNSEINRFILIIPNETHTIGNLLKRIIVNEIFPSCSLVIYDITFEKNLEITINYIEGDDIHKHLINSIKFAINEFNELKKEINKAFTSSI